MPARLLLIPLISLAPCALWLWYFISRSRYKRPSMKVVGISFFLGGLATLIASPLNFLGQSFILSHFGDSFRSRAIILFLIVGPVEEACKLLAVWIFAYRQKDFDEPLDGVIYSASAALGFAAIENVIYLSQNNPLLVLLRGPLSNPGHALFSSIWGLSLSEAKSAPNLRSRRFVIVLKGFLIAAPLHSLFDVLLLASERYGIILFFLVIASLLALFFWVRSRIAFHRDSSPHREGTLVLQVVGTCESCGSRSIVGKPCRQCGSDVSAPIDQPVCPVCAAVNEGDRCLRCGADLKLSSTEKLDRRPHLIAIGETGVESLACVLNREQITIGRTLNNDFVIDNPSVSRIHARISEVAGGHIVSDLGSSNGTFIDGRQIEADTLMKDGCEVRFGQARFVYRSR